MRCVVITVLTFSLVACCPASSARPTPTATVGTVATVAPTAKPAVVEATPTRRPATAPPRPATATPSLTASPWPPTVIPTTTATPRPPTAVPAAPTPRPPTPILAPTATPIPPPSPIPCNYIASRNSDVFHLPSCGEVKKIKPENVVCFATRDQALASGRRPGKCCNP